MFLQSAPYMTRANWCYTPEQNPAEGHSPGRAERSREGSGAARGSQGMWGPEPALASALPCPCRGCGAQGQEAHPWGTRAPGSWDSAAASSCPTAVPAVPASSLGDALPQHLSPHWALLAIKKLSWCTLCITCAVKGASYLMSYLHLPFLPTKVSLRLDGLLVQPLFSSTQRFPFCRAPASSSYPALIIPPKFCALHLSPI